MKAEDLISKVAQGKKASRVRFTVDREDGAPRLTPSVGRASGKKWKHTVTKRDDNGYIQEVVSEPIQD